MQNEFVPYKLAVKLKELGFDRECLGVYRYHSRSKTYTLSVTIYDSILNSGIKAPLWQQAFDWFREKHNLHSYITNNTVLKNTEEWKVIFDYYKLSHYDSDFKLVSPIQCNTYQEARLQCLTKLIEIVENGNIRS